MQQKNLKLKIIPIEQQLEIQSMKNCLSVIENIDKIELPNLDQQKHLIMLNLQDLDQLHLSQLIEKDNLQQQITHLQSLKNELEIKNEPVLMRLNMQSQQNNCRLIEVNEKLEAYQERYMIVQDQIEENKELQREQREQYLEQIQELQERENDLKKYLEKIDLQVKPQLSEMNKKIKEITSEITNLKVQLIKSQKRVNYQSAKKDYLQLSSCQQSINMFNIGEEQSQVIDKSKLGDKGNLFEVEKCENKDLQVISIEFQQEYNDFLNNKSQSIGNENLDPVRSQHQSILYDQSSLVSMQNPDIMFRLRPLIQGVEIFKKQFDTKLLTLVNQEQKYNILSLNKRVTPSVLGYQLRIATISPENMMLLRLVNPHENIPRSETSIDMSKARVMIPKQTNDVLKYQKQQQEPLSQIENQSKSMIKKNQMKYNLHEEEKNQYLNQCQNAQFLSLSIICENKEIDILVSSAGGYFNYQILRQGIQAMQSLTKKDNKKLQYLMKQ